MIPSLSFTYWSALVVAGALALYFGGRQAGNASGVAWLRDMSATGALGYSLVTLHAAVAHFQQLPQLVHLSYTSGLERKYLI